MDDIATKINNIIKGHNGTDAELIGKIARMVVNSTTMDLRVATSFARSQVESYNGLDIKLD